MRLFFALWPDPCLRKEVATLIGQLKPSQQARWISPVNLHLTLAFLGELPAGRVASLEDVGRDMQTPCGAVVLDRLELWRRPGVLCLVPADEPRQILALADELGRRLRLSGFDPERRAFRPHLTLARRAGVCPEYDFSRHPPLTLKPESLTLVESRQESGESRYQVLRSWPLPP